MTANWQNWQTDAHDPSNCPGCRPVVFELNGAARKPVPPDHPAQQAADRAWADARPREKKAWHRVTCLNSQDPIDLRLADRIVKKIRRVHLQ